MLLPSHPLRFLLGSPLPHPTLCLSLHPMPTSTPSLPPLREEDEPSWPQLCSPREKKAIHREYEEYLSPDELHTIECSFCGVASPNALVHAYSTYDLDISVLRTAVSELNTAWKMPHARAYKNGTLVEGCYQVCSTCKGKIRGQESKGVKSETGELKGGPAQCAPPRLASLALYGPLKTRVTKNILLLQVQRHSQVPPMLVHKSRLSRM